MTLPLGSSAPYVNSALYANSQDYSDSNTDMWRSQQRPIDDHQIALSAGMNKHDFKNQHVIPDSSSQACSVSTCEEANLPKTKPSNLPQTNAPDLADSGQFDMSGQ